MKCYRLRVSGITEQRKSGAWKMVELVCVSVTPIFISIMGDFGDDFRHGKNRLGVSLRANQKSRLSDRLCEFAVTHDREKNMEKEYRDNIYMIYYDIIYVYIYIMVNYGVLLGITVMI